MKKLALIGALLLFQMYKVSCQQELKKGTMKVRKYQAIRQNILK